MQINASQSSGGTYSISGYWMQGDERGEIKSGTYDPNTGAVRFRFFMPPNKTPGEALLKMGTEGRSLSGTYTQNNQDPATWHLNRSEAKFITDKSKPSSMTPAAKMNPTEQSEVKKSAPITLDQAQMAQPAKFLNAMPVGGRAILPILNVETPILVKIEGCKKRLIVSADMLFDSDKWELTEGSARTLVVLGPVIRDFGNHPVMVEGHTDSIGTDENNQKLSERRAQAVLDWLNKTRCVLGVVSIKGFGKKMPLTQNTFPNGSDNPSGRAKNRRVEITIDTCLNVQKAENKQKVSSKEYKDYNEGMEAIHKKDWENAAACFQRALTVNRDDMDAHFQLGYAKNQSKDFSVAVDELNKVIEANPLDADANLQIGIGYFGLNRVHEALQYLKQSCELNPKGAQAVFQLALAYKRLNDLENFNSQKKILEELDPEMAKTLQSGQ